MRRNNDLHDLTKEKYEEKKFLVFKKNRKKKKNIVSVSSVKP